MYAAMSFVKPSVVEREHSLAESARIDIAESIFHVEHFRIRHVEIMEHLRLREKRLLRAAELRLVVMRQRHVLHQQALLVTDTKLLASLADGFHAHDKVAEHLAFKSVFRHYAVLVRRELIQLFYVVKSDSREQEIFVEIRIHLARSLAHHHHALNMIKQPRVFRVVIAHGRRVIHYALLLAFVEAEAEALQFFIFKGIDAAHDIVIHILRLFGSSLEEIGSLVCSLTRLALYGIEDELILTLVITASAHDADDHARLYLREGFDFIWCEVPLHGLDVSRSVSERQIEVSLAVVAVADVHGLNEVSVLDAVPFIRPEVFYVIWFHM